MTQPTTQAIQQAPLFTPVDYAKNAPLISFEKDGKSGKFDILDGKFDYRGDLPVTVAAELLWQQITILANAWICERVSEALSVSSSKREALEAQVEAREDRLRMIISHATMGQTDGADMSVNDICVMITELRNGLYRDAQERAALNGAKP